MSNRQRQSTIRNETHPLGWVRALSGPAFIIGGWGVISTSFWIGVAAIYFGFLLLFLEIAFEPWVISNVSLFTHCMMLALCLVPVGWFTVAIVTASAPLAVESYAMRKGNYADGTEIAGIKWNPHFTELRVAVTNPSRDDYRDLDLTVKPEEWTYKAAILGDHFGCDLTSIGGDTFFTSIPHTTGIETFTTTKVGDGFDVHDSLGNVFTPLATKGGYALTCSKFPAHFTIQLVFAVVRLLPKLPGMKVASTDVVFGSNKTSVVALDGITSGLELFDKRPSPSTVFVTGGYARTVKRYSGDRVISINDGD